MLYLVFSALQRSSFIHSQPVKLYEKSNREEEILFSFLLGYIFIMILVTLSHYVLKKWLLRKKQGVNLISGLITYNPARMV